MNLSKLMSTSHDVINESSNLPLHIPYKVTLKKVTVIGKTIEVEMVNGATTIKKVFRGETPMEKLESWLNNALLNAGFTSGSFNLLKTKEFTIINCSFEDEDTSKIIIFTSTAISDIRDNIITTPTKVRKVVV